MDRLAAPGLPLAAIVGGLGLCGCAVFSSLFAPQPADQQAQTEREQLDRRQADEALAAQVDAARGPALAEGATLDAVLAYAHALADAIEAGAVDRGAVAAELAAELDAVLAGQAAATELTDHDRAELLLAWGDHFLLTGRADEAAARWLECVRIDPGSALAAVAFDALARSAPSPSADAAVLDACALIRPGVADPDIPDFVELCLDRADGDASKLAWTSANRDLAAYETELARREAQAQAQAQAQAAEQAQLDVIVTAAVFAAGRCRFSDCAKDGWETETELGTATTRCRFSDCLAEGWETSLPQGGTATTRCRFSKCLEDGWETSFPDGGTATTRCRFSNCGEDGWETSLPQGGTATTRCRFSSCFEDGWETDLPQGGSVRCSCRFSDCLGEGTECG